MVVLIVLIFVAIQFTDPDISFGSAPESLSEEAGVGLMDIPVPGSDVSKAIADAADAPGVDSASLGPADEVVAAAFVAEPIPEAEDVVVDAACFFPLVPVVADFGGGGGCTLGNQGTFIGSTIRSRIIIRSSASLHLGPADPCPD